MTLTARERWCHVVAAAFAILVISPLAVMLLDRRDPLVLTHGTITPNIVKPGDYITVTWYFEESRKCSGELTPVIVDGGGKVNFLERHQTTYQEALTRRSDGKSFSKYYRVPVGITPGASYYTPIIERWCNPLQRFLWPIKSPAPKLPFTIVP